MDDGEGEPDMSDDAPEDEAPAEEAPKKERPLHSLPKAGSAKWEDDFEDADWDELEEEEGEP